MRLFYFSDLKLPDLHMACSLLIKLIILNANNVYYLREYKCGEVNGTLLCVFLYLIKFFLSHFLIRNHLHKPRGLMP